MFVVYSNGESVFVTTIANEAILIKQDISENWGRDFSDLEKWDREERNDPYVYLESGGIKVQ